MNNEEIKKCWVRSSEKINIFHPTRLAAFGLHEQTVSFLSQVGLPAESAPFLNFNEDTEGEWNSIARVNEQYNTAEHFKKLIVIGSDGGGNLIVINSARNDLIEWIDHEDFFNSVYVNSSVRELAISLLAYEKFVQTVLAENGEDAYLEARFTDSQFNQLKLAIDNADSKVTQKVGFWHQELAGLLSNRAFYKKENGN